MLFTGQVKDEAYGIFEDYRALGGDGLVARAYLTWMSWQDFVRDEKVPEGIYGQLAQAIAWEAGLAPVCDEALYSEENAVFFYETTFGPAWALGASGG